MAKRLDQRLVVTRWEFRERAETSFVCLPEGNLLTSGINDHHAGLLGRSFVVEAGLHFNRVGMEPDGGAEVVGRGAAGNGDDEECRGK